VIAHAPAPRCPACKGTDLRHEAGDRHQCTRCGWRCVVGGGKARDWIDWTRAGRRRR